MDRGGEKGKKGRDWGRRREGYGWLIVSFLSADLLQVRLGLMCA